MVRTNLDLLFLTVLRNERLTRKNICEVCGIEPSNLSRLLHKELPTPQFVELLDIMGYDLEFTAVKREKNASFDDILEAIKNERTE